MIITFAALVGYLLAFSPLETRAARRTSSFSSRPVTKLTQEDFKLGTLRITEPGSYQLTEDIKFSPQEKNDYWPPFQLWHKYPPTAYYLGFFAAITIEADDVEIDLNGFEICQGEEFYLVQRFFNVIELNDRVFMQNNGVSSLNYQKTDELMDGHVAGEIVIPTNVVIKNGLIGRSSHAGIHGNGVTGVTITDVTITDFEVAGIQCNGCKEVQIVDSIVGPSATAVPALATFANARFLEFYSQTLIPEGFKKEPDGTALLLLLEENISFADRPGSSLTLQDIFDRLKRAVQLFRAYNLGTLEDPSVDDMALLDEAKKVFGNPTGLADGSVQYGILLNRLGMTSTDENFNGAGRETEDIVLKNVKIQGMHSNPIEVPSLMTEQGSHMQGPGRDLLRIYDITTDKMRSLQASFYKGNFLSDAYFAMWQLSNDFYRLRVFDSDCGNFGSNASFPMNLKFYPSSFVPTCAEEGMSTDPDLTGRQVTMLQKRYFGGLQLSQGVYNWATTPRTGLETVLASPASADVLRSGGRHKLVCDHDTMFHPMHGVVGLKIVEGKNVAISGLEISDLSNSADLSPWVCRHKWQLQPSGEDIMAVSADLNSAEAPMVRGVELVRCDDVEFTQVSIMGLRSDEGGVKGIDVMGDGNDRSDHADDTGVKFSEVLISDLSGPGGINALSSSATPLMATTGITVGEPEEFDSSLKNPRVVLNYQVVNSGFFVSTVSQASVDRLMEVSSLDTEDKIRAFRGEILAFYETHYGFRYEEGANEKYSLVDSIPVYTTEGELTDTIVTGVGQMDTTLFKLHGSSLCVSDAGGTNSQCTDAIVALLHEFGVGVVLIGPSGYTFHGAFGKDAGQYARQSSIIPAGLNVFEGLDLPGVNQGANLEVKFFGECPYDVRPIKGPDVLGLYINCALESNIFGKGIGTGGFIFTETGVSNGFPTMIFDDYVLDPTPITTQTNTLDFILPDVQYNDLRFSYIADGTYNTKLSGVEAFAYPMVHHYTHEAAVEYFKLRTSLKTDAEMLALRKQFLTRLREDFEISIIDPDAFDDIPLDGVIDLGGGNHITGYVVNEDANQRVLTKQGSLGEPTIAMPPASRLHEGGFRLVVGRAGLDTVDGRSPFGTTISEGIYILENGAGDGSDMEIEFYSMSVVDLNSWATSIVYNYLYSEEYGEGRLLAAQPMPLTNEEGIHLKISGALVFGNIGLW